MEGWPILALLINNPNLKTFQVILDGVDTWLKRKYFSRVCMLQVVALRNKHHVSSEMQDGREGRDHLVETMLKEPVVEGHLRYTRKQHLRVFSDLSFIFSLHEDKHHTRCCTAQRRERIF